MLTFHSVRRLNLARLARRRITKRGGRTGGVIQSAEVQSPFVGEVPPEINRDKTRVVFAA